MHIITQNSRKIQEKLNSGFAIKIFTFLFNKPFNYTMCLLTDP